MDFCDSCTTDSAFDALLQRQSDGMMRKLMNRKISEFQSDDWSDFQTRDLRGWIFYDSHLCDKHTKNHANYVAQRDQWRDHKCHKLSFYIGTQRYKHDKSHRKQCARKRSFWQDWCGKYQRNMTDHLCQFDSVFSYHIPYAGIHQNISYIRYMTGCRCHEKTHQKYRRYG